MNKLLHWRIELLIVALLCGCAEPPAAPPQKAPWLDASQQIQLLRQKDDGLRTLAARNLGNIGLQAADAIPELEQLTNSSNPKLKAEASGALVKIRAAVADAAP